MLSKTLKDGEHLFNQTARGDGPVQQGLQQVMKMFQTTMCACLLTRKDLMQPCILSRPMQHHMAVQGLSATIYCT